MTDNPVQGSGFAVVDEVAAALMGCEDAAVDRGPVTEEWAGLDLATAYAVQDRTLALRLARGERTVGVKLGLTSRAKQVRMGIDSPLTAWLTDAMVLPIGEPVPFGNLIHPRAEPEIVLVLGRTIEGPGVTAATAMAAVELVYGGIEIIDSRFRDFRFSLPDVVSDNASSSRFVVGPVGVDPRQLDLSLEACIVELDGRVVDSATGAAVQGHPGEALALAANALAERSLALEEGMIVLTGGMTDAVPLSATTTLTVDFTHLGTICLGGA